MSFRGPIWLLMAGFLLVVGCSQSEPAIQEGVPGSSMSQLETQVLTANAYVACMERELGLVGEATYRGSPLDARGSFAFSFQDPAGQMNEKAESPEALACEAEVDNVWLVWADQAAERADRDEYEALVDCLRVEDIKIESADPAALSITFGEHPNAYRACHEAVFKGG